MLWDLASFPERRKSCRYRITKFIFMATEMNEDCLILSSGSLYLPTSAILLLQSTSKASDVTSLFSSYPNVLICVIIVDIRPPLIMSKLISQLM